MTLAPVAQRRDVGGLAAARARGPADRVVDSALVVVEWAAARRPDPSYPEPRPASRLDARLARCEAGSVVHDARPAGIARSIASSSSRSTRMSRGPKR